MFEKIVVPLDGSQLAECCLPHVEQLARGCKVGEVVLVSVTERIDGMTSAPEVLEAYEAGQPVRVSGAGAASGARVAVGKMEKQAGKYLAGVARRLGDSGVNAHWEVLLGNPAEEIVTFAEDRGMDMIVMASHGRSGPSRWALGSIADKVFRASCVPVLMVRAPGCTNGI